MHRVHHNIQGVNLSPHEVVNAKQVLLISTKISVCVCLLKNTSTLFTMKTKRKSWSKNKTILHNVFFIFFVSIVDVCFIMVSIKRWGIRTWKG